MLSAHFDIGLSPTSDHSDIGLKGYQSNIISDIGLTLLVISDILFKNLHIFCGYLHIRSHTLVARAQIVHVGRYVICLLF
jgi:hypothetical protein